MRKLISIFSITAFMMVAVVANAQQKFGHVNTQDLFYSMPEVQTVQTQLEAKGKEYEGQLTTMYTQYETIAAEIQNNGGSWMQAVLEAKYNELYQLEERILLLEQQAQEDLMAYEAKLLAPVEEKAYNAIQTVANANGYTYVLDSSLGVYLVLPEGDDLTNMVKAQLGIN